MAWAKMAKLLMEGGVEEEPRLEPGLRGMEVGVMGKGGTIIILGADLGRRPPRPPEPRLPPPLGVDPLTGGGVMSCCPSRPILPA